MTNYNPRDLEAHIGVKYRTFSGGEYTVEEGIILRNPNRDNIGGHPIDFITAVKLEKSRYFSLRTSIRDLKSKQKLIEDLEREGFKPERGTSLVIIYRDIVVPGTTRRLGFATTEITDIE